MAVTIILYAILIVLIIRVFLTQKSLKKRRQLIEVVKAVHDPDFFDKLESFEKQMQDDPEILNKGRIIGLWGMADRNETDDFEKTLNDLDVSVLIKQDKNGKYSIDDNEDSFFYLMLVIPELLYHSDHDDLRKEVNQKINEQDDKLKGQLIREIYLAVNKYYDKTEDRGLSFYQKVLNGDYAEYTYNKQFIGLYKDVVNAQAYVILKEDGKENTLEDADNMMDQFDETTIGRRWLKDLGIHQNQDSEEESNDDNDTEVFDMNHSDKKEEQKAVDTEVMEEDKKTEEKKDSSDDKESV